MPVALSNEPSAVEIWPVTVAEKSGPDPPTVLRLVVPVLRGGYCFVGCGVRQGTSRHFVSGKDAVKQPFFGRGLRSMSLRHFSRSIAAVCEAAFEGSAEEDPVGGSAAMLAADVNVVAATIAADIHRPSLTL